MCEQKSSMVSSLLLGLTLLSMMAGCSQQTASSLTTIMEIQGSEQFSPLDGQLVETSGVVTLLAPDDYTGFWIQDPKGDGDSATSDGIFVSLDEAASEIVKPAVGDLVRLTAQIEDEHRRVSLPCTILQNITRLDILSSGNALPDPVPVLDLPNEDLQESIAFWEPLEGMRVTISNAKVVAGTSSRHNFAILTAADAVPGSGYHPETGYLVIRSLGDGKVDYNPERILVSNATLEAPIEARPGDDVISLIGVVDYVYDNYKVMIETAEVKSRNLPAAPVSVRSGPTGNLVVTNYNPHDLLDTVDNPDRVDERWTPTPEELETRLTKLARSIIVELDLPQIITLQEFESTELLQQIGDRVNAAVGSQYIAVSEETNDERGLEVGFLYDDARVDLLDAYQLSGPDVDSAFGLEGTFKPVHVPGRQPLVGVFRVAAENPPLTIVVNKFKSKRLEDPILNLSERHIRFTENQRKAQAKVVRDFANTILNEDPEALLMVIGDLGDFQFGEPDEGVHAVAIIEGGEGEVPLSNLINMEDEGEAFTYVFRGVGVVLSHVLVSPALLEHFVGVDILHFNAVFNAALGSDPTVPFVASDRDPVEARFTFE